LLLCSALSLAACQSTSNNAPDDGANGPAEPAVTGALDVSAATTADVPAFQIDVASPSGMGTDSAFVAATTSGSGGPTGFASFTLKPGAYDVTVTPMRTPGVPVPGCTPATSRVTVTPNHTAAVVLTARCSMPTGGIIVTGTVDF